MAIPEGYEPTSLSIGRVSINQDTRALLVDADLTITSEQADTIAAAMAEAVGEVVMADGAKTDAPLAGNTTLEDATSRSGISLYKRIVNVLIAVLAKLPTVGTAGTASANVLTVQGKASMTPLNVTLDEGQFEALGDAVVASSVDGDKTDEPLAGNVTEEGATSRSSISLLKRVTNVLIAVLAKLPAFGTAGTASANVITVQGRTSMTPLDITLSASQLSTITLGTLVSLSQVTVDATLNGKALATLLSAALDSGLKRLVLIPKGGGTIYWSNGNASATSPVLPTGGIDLPVTKTVADTLRFFAANVDMTVLQFS